MIGMSDAMVLCAMPIIRAPKLQFESRATLCHVCFTFIFIRPRLSVVIHQLIYSVALFRTKQHMVFLGVFPDPRQRFDKNDVKLYVLPLETHALPQNYQ